MIPITHQSRATLLAPILAASSIVEKSQVFPILSHILMQRDEENISFLSSDADIQIKTWIPVGEENDGQPVKTTFPARKCIDILRSFNDQTSLSFTQHDSLLTISSGQAKFTLQTLSPDDFPTLFEIGEPIANFTVNQKSLKQLMTKVQFSMAFQDVRYYFNGMLLSVEGKKLRTVATDGHRLAVAELDNVLAYEISPVEVILPRKTVSEVLKLLSTEENKTVDICFYPNHIVFLFENLELRSKLIDGKFPDYNLVIPKDYDASFEINASIFKSILQRSAILADDKLKGIRLMLEEGQLTVTAVNSDQEQAQESLSIENKDGVLDIGLNVTYLLDVLSNIDAQHFCCLYRDGKSSILISYKDDPNYQHIIMPMRI